MNMLTIGARKKLKLAFWQILRCTRPWSKIYFKACLWKSLPVRGPHASNYFFLSTLEDFQREMLSISHWRAPSAALVRNDNGSRFDCWWALRLLCISVIKSLSFHNIAGVDYFDLRLINGPSLSKDKPFMSVKREDVMDHEHVVIVVRGRQNYYHAFVAVKRTSAA